MTLILNFIFLTEHSSLNFTFRIEIVLLHDNSE